MTDDISHILQFWPHDPDEDVVVRIIKGIDGRDKIQMRIDMGVMQMEIDGNPTGENPHGYESWFEYFVYERDQAESNEIDDYFALTEEDCSQLRREAIRYYHRYLCLMKLGDYERVIRDTDRNLHLFSFIKKYATREIDRWSLDQYRPYVIMMNARARASLVLQNSVEERGEISREAQEEIEEALDHIDSGIGEIARFYEEYGMTSEMEGSMELAILTALKREFVKSLPHSLEEQLKMAVEEERFEDAARIRDTMRTRTGDI